MQQIRFIFMRHEVRRTIAARHERFAVEQITRATKVALVEQCICLQFFHTTMFLFLVLTL